MMRPRVSLRRVFVALLVIAGGILFWLNILEVTLFTSNTEKNTLDASDPTSLNVIESGPYKGWKKVDEEDKHLEVNPIGENQPVTDSPIGIDGGKAPRSRPLKPWFVKGGVRKPIPALRDLQTNKRVARLLPSEAPGDRIPDQLMFVPPEYDSETTSPKTILLPNGLGAWNIHAGSEVFTKINKCPVNTCEITADHAAAVDADLIIFKDHFIQPNVARPKNQIWMLYYLECPYHTPNVKSPDVFNWTSTYRRDSDVVAPYERWYYYNSRITQVENMERNYAANKTKKVAWFVSNCGARNHRLQYALELKKYIQVDIYGACGTMRCPRYNADRCFEILDKDYKFYLAFENSNCKDYITEKFFVNGLGRNILPIVMGARPEDYEMAAPYNSYIHVDEFESPKELAEYLHRLDKDDELYNSYFKWKGTGEFINTYFWCRVCAMLHDDIQPKNYRDVNEWWRGNGICTHGSWRRKTAEQDRQDLEDDAEGI